MRYLKIISVALTLIVLSVTTGCKNNLFDKKISDTNYIIVLDQLKAEEEITEDEYNILNNAIQDIVVIRYANEYGKAITATKYGRHYAYITYWDVYYCEIEKPKKNKLLPKNGDK